MPGASAQASAVLHVGVEALQKALPLLPMGSELHNAVLKAVSDIAKRMEGAQDNAAMIQQLVSMAREAQAQPQQAAQMRGMMPGGAPNAPPMMPPPAPGGAPGGAPG